MVKLTKIAPIQREKDEITPQIDIEKQKKLEIIDKFIEANPKLLQLKKT